PPLRHRDLRAERLEHAPPGFDAERGPRVARPRWRLSAPAPGRRPPAVGGCGPARESRGASGSARSRTPAGGPGRPRTSSPVPRPPGNARADRLRDEAGVEAVAEPPGDRYAQNGVDAGAPDLEHPRAPDLGQPQAADRPAGQDRLNGRDRPGV